MTRLAPHADLDSRLRLEDVSQIPWRTKPKPDAACAARLRNRQGLGHGPARRRRLHLAAQRSTTTARRTARPHILSLPTGDATKSTPAIDDHPPRDAHDRPSAICWTHRFVGNSAGGRTSRRSIRVRLVNKSLANLTFDVAYVDQVNRVFGKDSPQGRYEGDSVLANVAYQFARSVSSPAFGYRLDFDPIATVPRPCAIRRTLVALRGERPLQRLKLGYWRRTRPIREDTRQSAHSSRYDLAELTHAIAVQPGRRRRGRTTAAIHDAACELHKFRARRTVHDDAGGRHRGSLYHRRRHPAGTSGPFDTLSALASYHLVRGERIAHDYGAESMCTAGAWHRLTGLRQVRATTAPTACSHRHQQSSGSRSSTSGISRHGSCWRRSWSMRKAARRDASQCRAEIRSPAPGDRGSHVSLPASCAACAGTDCTAAGIRLSGFREHECAPCAGIRGLRNTMKPLVHLATTLPWDDAHTRVCSDVRGEVFVRHEDHLGCARNSPRSEWRSPMCSRNRIPPSPLHWCSHSRRRVRPGVGRAAPSPSSAPIELASEQPASGSGSRTVLSGAKNLAASAMKCTPHITMTRAFDDAACRASASESP